MRNDNGMKRSSSMPKLLMKKKYNIHSIPGIIVLKGNTNEIEINRRMTTR